jgi:hypothetical protein
MALSSPIGSGGCVTPFCYVHLASQGCAPGLVFWGRSEAQGGGEAPLQSGARIER